MPVTENPVMPSIFVSIIILISISCIFLTKLSNESLEMLRPLFFGIAFISLLFAGQRFLSTVNFFTAGAYETDWNIGGKPYVYYPPELIYAVVRSSFLAGVFAFLERYVNFLEEHK